MSLGHVYIVLEPVGCARLTFDDNFVLYELCVFDDRSMFGVLDEITDVTRSLEMVKTSRLIYWKAMFGHRKGFEWFGDFFEYRDATETPRES